MELFFILLGILLLTALFLSISKARRHVLGAIFSILAILGFAQELFADSSQKEGLGLLPETPERLKYIEENGRFIGGVKPNNIGFERIREYRKDHGLIPITMGPASSTEEFTIVIGEKNTNNGSLESLTADILPPSVDNSTLPSFPPIGNQGGLNSCAAWATTYYQYTHEYGLLNGLNNQNSNANIFSPTWTYNNLNGGGDNGLTMFQPYALFSQNGLVTMLSFFSATNYLEWDLNSQDWKSALSTRSLPIQYLTGLGGATQNLVAIKQMLANGHILSFGTLGFFSWVQGVVGTNPATTNPHAGEIAVLWQNGNGGGHALNIVGYDDTMWIDINGNGVVDPGELGAFKVVNSWGTDWANGGFIWIAYDAFLTTSAVENGPTSSTRQPIAAASRNWATIATPLAANYAPKLIAQFTLSQSIRDQIAVSVGVSATSTTTPTTLFASDALKNQGGNYEFDGTTPGAPQTAVFYLDLTELLPAQDDTLQRYYLIVNDDVAENPTVIDSFELIDLVANTAIPCQNTPVSCDNSQAVLYVDYAFQANPPPPLLPLVITSPTAKQNVKGAFWITAAPQNAAPISKVEFYIDNVLQGTVTTSPYTVHIGSKTLSEGSHTIKVIAYDDAGDTATATEHIHKKK